ncbi:DUF6286 domain-containing protein [Pseudonocardia sp. KRD291]|uniref:DUF6286 domain-containing protein n=1 Tax=Pseudonocardia sp. KRD291 TaxID=2792007 RepID=UPI001C4A68EF|nr:DUF6286 domain-containing protein [Pseudonocardia sp. KRD291]MBW0102894.1 hypothetical protein [Pseudonocardia sp. KRD291]
MIRRPRRSTPAAVVAVVLLAACVLVAVSCVQILLAQTPLLPLSASARAGTSLTASSTPVVAGAVVAAVIGLVLLLAGLLPGSPVVLATADAGTGIDTGIDRRSLQRALTHSASRVDGVDSAQVTSGRRRVTATVRTTLDDTDAVRGAVTEALRGRLEDLSPGSGPLVTTRTVRKP